jgi:hypothetical protein
MPRVTKRKARKDYPNAGIKKGDEYYYWKRKTGPASGVTCRSLTPPTPSQLNSGFAGEVGELEASLDAADDVEGIRSVVEDIRSLQEETQGKFDNMPEGLQQGDTGQLLEERAGQLEEWVSNIESACDAYDQKIGEIDAAEADWDDDYDGEEEPDDRQDELRGEYGDDPDWKEVRDEALEELKQECGSLF